MSKHNDTEHNDAEHNDAEQPIREAAESQEVSLEVGAEAEAATAEPTPTANPQPAQSPESLFTKLGNLLNQGAHQNLIIQRGNGQSLAEMPLALGLALIGLLALTLPLLTLILFAVALLTKTTFNVVAAHQ